MSTIGTRGPDVFKRHPDHARLTCDMLSDSLAASGRYAKRRVYQVLRSLSPEELYDMVVASQESKERLVREFGPLYHREVGEPDSGPLFEG